MDELNKSIEEVRSWLVNPDVIPEELVKALNTVLDAAETCYRDGNDLFSDF